MAWFSYHIPSEAPIDKFAPHLERFGALPVAPFGKPVITDGEYEFRVLTDNATCRAMIKKLLDHFTVPYREVEHADY